MNTCWIVVADSTRARLFRLAPAQEIEELEVLVNPDARLREQDLVSDSPGRGLNRARSSRFSMAEAESHREHAEKSFARQLASHLRDARLDGNLTRLHLVAAPAFLGELRLHLDEATRALIRSETAKNVSRLDAKELRLLLPEYL